MFFMSILSVIKPKYAFILTKLKGFMPIFLTFIALLMALMILVQTKKSQKKYITRDFMH